MLQPLADLLWSEDNLPSFQTERPLCSVDQLMIDATSAAMRIGSDSPYCLLNDPWTANLKGLSKRGVQSIKVLPEATTEFGIDRFTPETYNLHSAGASFDPCTFDLALRVVSRIIGPVAAELGDLGVGLLLYDIYTCDEASIASLFTAYSPSSATELERLVERDLRPLLTALKLADSSMAVTKAQELMERGVPVVPSRPARILRQGAVDVMPVASTRQWKRRHGLVAGDAKIEDIYDVSPPQADGLLVGQSLELSHPHWHTDVSPLAVSTQLVTIPSHIMNILDLKRQLIPRLETADVHSVLTGIIRPLDLFVKDPNVLASEYLDLLGEASVELVMFIVECAPSLSEQWSELKEATLRRMWSRSIKNRDRVFIGGRGEYQFRSFVKSVDVSDVVECVEWHTSEQAIQQSLKPGIAPPGPAGKLDTKFRLPPDAIVDTTEDTETITLPAPAPVVFDDEDRVPVSVLPDWAQLAFHGITSFNPVQSRVLDKAFGSHDNLLVMAPTGAGKTNIALLAILHQIGQNRTRSGKIRPAFSFKMIYIAPMKSLVGEMVRKFESCLKPLGITVCEMTGDQPLTRLQMMSVHLVVTVPEKWDIITRNSPDTALMECVKVVIVDEVHLLNDESRGPVLESVIVRHKYFVETGQSACRLVALSATLPNYQDVGLFLGAPASGLFAFDASWRPIPLEQKFTGVHVSGMNSFAFRERLNEEAFYATLEAVREGHQVIIFVHSRADTSATLRYILSHANEEQLQMFRLTTDPGPLIKRTRHHQLKDFIPYGMAMHNAGMLRSDRNLVESLFYKGDVRVLCSTATLAWGVNLPARQVIIKGTSVYDAARGGLVDIGIMDVLQVFGRAGRPQFDTLGSAHLITEHAKLESYVQAASANLPCESHLAARLQNLLNAEVSTGVVASIEEGMDWLAHSFYLIRAMHQPLKYNLTPDDVAIDADLSGFRRQLVHKAALELNQRKLVRFNPLSGVLSATELGRVATRFYLDVDTIGTFIRELPLVESPVDLLKVYCKASEFRDLKAREDERNELDHLAERCPLKLPQTKSQLTEKVYVGGRLKESKPQAKQGGDDSVANIRRKVGILIQANLSGLPIESHTLTSDMYHINQNAGRVSRAMFEMSLTPCFKMQHLTTLLLEWTKMMEQRLWFIGPCKVHPLMQFVDRWAVQHNDSSVHLRESTVARLEGYNMDRLLDFTPQELNAAAGRDWKKVKQCLDAFPWIEACYKIRPMTPTIIQVHMQVSARFNWSRRWHGTIQRFHLWVSNPAEASIIHHEVFSLTEEKYNSDDPMELIFTLPVHEPRPAQYSLQVVSDSWSGSSYDDAIALGSFIPPSSSSSQTALLPLDPLPVAVLQDPRFRTLYTGFKFLNPIQTQVFHACFHTDANILLGAPTGSGKTMVGEFTVMRLFKREPKAKVVYIAPLKALSRERFDDWKAKFDPLGFPVVQMTGDVTPDFLAIRRASIIITTPEKWDGVSRMWRQRSYVKDVRLVVVDEIHLLGYDRGPVIEAVVSRMRFIAHKVGKGMRFVGLSTALDNSEDIAMWLGVCQNGHFNFRPAVRPVPCRVTIQGFHEKHYCPRMGTMNKPAFSIICNDSPNHPVLIFVSSRRQTRLTALDLIACCAKDNCPFRFKHESRLPSGEFQSALENFKDSTVQHCVR
ncbi:MAG: uncharacterized protein KVP18_001187 [Porospora cf. gigantea A]|uniref:uncharacterized protein n=1 Tax=Porospora cf. gigantea A TaxID=2853593 RepID=UPI0035594EA5|nr:MAG: hypothetical protein KVP18_001187 [Porospora cf. gigantea A]